MQKGISIILPTLNRADYLASTVDCLIEQDFGEPYEIIIVDQSAAMTVLCIVVQKIVIH